MKTRKMLVAILAVIVIMTMAIPLVACDDTNRQDGNANGMQAPLNIIDDNYRNGYEIFVRSFYDSGDDGVGDLKGVTHQLDWIKEQGYNLIWLMPIMESTTYHGYDVVDYYSVEKDYGTIDDFKELTAQAHSRGINVIIDMVINHSSVSCDWFQSAKKSLEKGETVKDNKYIDYYNFIPNSQDGYNQLGTTNWYYESRFDKIMPDLNLDSEEVKKEITNIFKFWLQDMDCDGFRLDAVTSYYTGNVPENVKFLSWVNQTAKSIKEDAYIVGEAWEGSDGAIREYYESGCDSFFLFTMSAGVGSSSVKALLSPLYTKPGEKLEQLLINYQNIYNKGILAPFLGNHDTALAANMLGTKDFIKIGAGIMAIMNGTTWVYYGDPIGMTCSDKNSDPTKRVPMRWANSDVAPGQVFMPPSEGMRIDPKSYSFGSVEDQEGDPDSILNYYKQAMRMRNSHPEIARGKIEIVESISPYVAAIKKTWNDSSIIILVNLSSEESFDVNLSMYGDVEVRTTLNVFDASSVKNGKLTLQPYSIAVLQ